jgi:signal transduction histidine kinase
MGPLRRHRWFVAAAGITLAFAVVSQTAHKSGALTAFADLLGLALMLLAAGITLTNAYTRSRQERTFWALMTLGLALWISNQAAWTYFGTALRRHVPNPFFFDIVLFFHPIPMIAAVAWRPDLTKVEGKRQLSVLHFLMLLGWWVFLYAFLVFPHQYVVLNANRYSVYYDRLFGLENALLLATLAFAAFTSLGGWRRLYLHYLAAAFLYAINSQFLNRAAAGNILDSGSPNDIPVIGTVAWVAAASLSAREWDLRTALPPMQPPWRKILSRLAMLAILSLPALGLWEVFFDQSPAPSRLFRLFTVLAAMLLLGAFVFLRHYVQDQALIGALRESRQSYDSQMRLQKQLMQREKLASLGTLVAGAAHEISHPLTVIMNYSEQLWAQERLTEEQKALLRKIVTQAQRTRDLVGNLLSFAQQAPTEKILVDLSVLLTRASQMLEPRYPGGKIRVSLSVAADFPRVQGNPHQLLQVFVEIIENAVDALQEAGGGLLEIIAQRQGNEAVLQFADSGPGIREPERVFDPFYTTKPIGKGPGLGLSFVYGVVQDHGGQITCQNKREGGALFAVRLPAATEPAVQGAGASGD